MKKFLVGSLREGEQYAGLLMNARSSYEEMREQAISDLIPKHAAEIRERVEAGAQPIALIADGVTDLLYDGKLAQQLARLSVCAPIIAGSVLGFLTAHVIAEQAEIEAIKEVERMECSRQESASEARIESAAWNREMSKYPQPMRIA